MRRSFRNERVSFPEVSILKHSTMTISFALLMASAQICAAAVDPAAKCAASKTKAAAKNAAAKLVCNEKARLAETMVDEACLEKAATKFAGAITKAESSGACLTVGDAPDLLVAVDEFVDTVLGLTDITTTTTTTTTTIPPSQGTAALGNARASADGAVDIDVPYALVTYVPPLVGTSPNDPPGFYVQAETGGSALLVAVDPATLTPVPAVGDQVSFTIGEMATNASERRAAAISDFAVHASGIDVTPLAEDVSSAGDLVINISLYEAELVTFSATISGAFAAAGSGFVSAPIDTAGLVSDPSFKLRVPSTLQASLALVSGCTLKVVATPLRRFNTQTQPHAWVEADIEELNCP
jgi:hypothetical protein